MFPVLNVEFGEKVVSGKKSLSPFPVFWVIDKYINWENYVPWQIWQIGSRQIWQMGSWRSGITFSENALSFYSSCPYMFEYAKIQYVNRGRKLPFGACLVPQK